MMKVFLRHVRIGIKNQRNCSAGLRLFAKKHDLDYSEFIFNGIDHELLLQTGDEEAIHAVKRAEVEYGVK